MRGLIIDFTTFLQEIDYARCFLVRWFPAQRLVRRIGRPRIHG